MQKDKNLSKKNIPWHHARWFKIIKKIIGVVITYLLTFVVVIIAIVCLSKFLGWDAKRFGNQSVFAITLLLGNLVIGCWLKFKKEVGIFLLSFVLTIIILFYTPLKNVVESYIWITSQVCDAYTTFLITKLIILPFFPLGTLILFSYIRKKRSKDIYFGITNFVIELGLGILSFLISIIAITIMVWLVHLISGAGWCGT